MFLSTDAGGVGLNLQTASAVINMDLPWNPAVLEQRIGRVHRLGQRRPVRVVNFISEATIEHGMLPLLAFKKSLFAGVLDGTSDKVFMGDSALNRFMKTFETAASSIPHVSPTPVDEDESVQQRPAPAPPPPPSATDGGPGTGKPADLGTQALGELLAKGAEFLQHLGRALADGGAAAGGQAARGTRHTQGVQPRIGSDSATGRPELRITLPDQQTMQSWVGQLSNLLGSFGARD